MTEEINTYSLTLGNRLRTARQIKGMTMEQLAKKASLSKQAISKFEAGLLKASSETIIKMANAMDIPQEFFFNEDVSGLEIKLVGVSHRERQKLDEVEFVEIKNMAVDFLIRIMEVERIGDQMLEFNNPIADLEIRNRKDVEKAVKQLRKKWHLGNVQIPNVTDLLESKGVKMLEVAKSESFEGFAAWAGTIPIIVINSSIKEITRIRFTTLHELGHIVLQFKELDEITIERLCNAFSGELLFSTEALIIELGSNRSRIAIEELKNIKEKYGISASAIILSAYKANVINYDTFRKWKINYENWVKEGNDFGKYTGTETPRRFNKILYSCLVENRISLGRAAVLARLKESDLKKRFHSLEKQQLN